MSVDTTGWTTRSFEVDGIEFNSVFNPNSRLGSRMASVPDFMFEAMNVGAIRDCVGNVLTMTRQEIFDKLVEVNEGATEAVLELA